MLRFKAHHPSRPPKRKKYEKNLNKQNKQTGSTCTYTLKIIYHAIFNKLLYLKVINQQYKICSKGSSYLIFIFHSNRLYKWSLGFHYDFKRD